MATLGDSACFMCQFPLCNSNKLHSKVYQYDSYLLSCECRTRYVLGQLCRSCYHRLLYLDYNPRWLEDLKENGIDYAFIRSNKITMYNEYNYRGLKLYVIKKYTYCMIEKEYINDMIYFCDNCINDFKYTINLY